MSKNENVDLAALHAQVSDEIIGTALESGNKKAEHIRVLLDAILPKSPEEPTSPPVSETQQKREKAKAEMFAYRDAAKKWAYVASSVVEGHPVSVGPWANVQVVDGGAFVECQIFVPFEALGRDK